MTTQNQIDVAISVMSHRSKLLGDSYPFQVLDVGVQRRDDALEYPYSAMLLITSGGPLLSWSESFTRRSAHAFEHLVVEGMTKLLGDGSKALRFAFPSDENRPQAFPDAVKWLAARMGISHGASYRPPRRKDGGVDVVAWRPFPDGRSGFPVALVQATVEQKFVHKATDVDLQVWSGWLRLDVNPSVVLAIPRTVGKTESWNEVSTRAVLLDRNRIAGLLGSSASGNSKAHFATLFKDELSFLKGQIHR